jgi:antitoxin (DNA-binding transcriptional repressor) of toxin-antitoxin stability system
VARRRPEFVPGAAGAEAAKLEKFSHGSKTQVQWLPNIKGNEIVIAMKGKPVAKLTPIEKKPKRRPGALKGKIKIAKDFDAPLPKDILSNFEGSLSNCL